MSKATQSYYQQNEQINKHYERLANNYNYSWQHSPAFVRAVSQKCVKSLELKSTDLLVDIGCGTGLFSEQISEIAKLANPVLCVDSSSSMLENLPSCAGLKAILMDANNFIAIPNKYDKILIKHAIHLIPDRDDFLKQLYERLKVLQYILCLTNS